MTGKFQEDDRGTGRSTGLLLQAIGGAALAKGDEVEFVDHYRHTYYSAGIWKEYLESIIQGLRLRMTVRREECRVFVRSCLSEQLAQGRATP
ncbi:unnamed protein product [marine sediment metagenome]|uniref:Uncharacterized protein n=1 Tax=marine sediment metagenome TaxID=412755 RepID=X0YLM3_9ZZZZ